MSSEFLGAPLWLDLLMLPTLVAECWLLWKLMPRLLVAMQHVLPEADAFDQAKTDLIICGNAFLRMNEDHEIERVDPYTVRVTEEPPRNAVDAAVARGEVTVYPDAEAFLGSLEGERREMTDAEVDEVLRNPPPGMIKGLE